MDRDLLAVSLVPGIGPKLTRALLDRFGSPDRIRMASASELATVPHIGSRLAEQMAAALQGREVEAEIERMGKRDVELTTVLSPDYPASLKGIADHPSVLYRKGSFLPKDAEAVGIVGSRQCTPYGRKMAERIAGELSKAGYTIVSGLARGIDGVAHEATLAAGGRTIAVLAGGLSAIYPPEHADLAERVARQGLLLSETAMALQPQRGMFHNRNRLISGLSKAVVIIEANDKSGALITARHAAEQGRDVLVVPANADSPASAGSLRLIRDGARLVRNVDDILEDVRGLKTATRTLFEAVEDETKDPTPPPTPTRPADLDEAAAAIWDMLDEPKHIDQIAQKTALPIARLSGILMGLEMRRIVQRQPGNIYAR